MCVSSGTQAGEQESRGSSSRGTGPDTRGLAKPPELSKARHAHHSCSYSIGQVKSHGQAPDQWDGDVHYSHSDHEVLVSLSYLDALLPIAV